MSRTSVSKSVTRNAAAVLLSAVAGTPTAVAGTPTAVAGTPTAAAVILSVAKDLLLLLSLLLLALVPANAQQKTDVEKTLFRLEDDFAQAVVKRDARALGQIVAPKWVYSDESGVMERDAGIKVFTSGSDTVTKASNANMRAFIYGDAAVVIGVLQMSGRGPQGAFTHRYRYTDAWAKLDGRWQCIASQDYLMPNAKR